MKKDLTRKLTVLLASIMVVGCVLSGCTISAKAPDTEDIFISETVVVSENEMEDVFTVIETSENIDLKEETFQNTEVIVVEDEEEEVVEETGILLKTEHVKNDYVRTELLDLSGLEVFVLYSNGDERILSEDAYQVCEVDLTTCGEKKVVVTYADFVESFQVNVSYFVNDVEPQVKYSSTSLNMRSGPGTEFEALTNISMNTGVTVIGIADNGWAKVVYQDREYFCSNKYLMEEKKVVVAPEVVQPVVNTDMSGMVFEGEIDQACKDKAIELYSKVPQNVKDAIVNSNYYMIVSTNPDYTQGNAGIYLGYIYPYYVGQYMAVYATSVWNVNIAVIHEIGHFIDNYVGYRDGYDPTPNATFPGVSACDEWKEIYEAEVAASGFPSWTNYCQEEYFAECVWKALAEPEWCKKTIPRSYEFVMNIINGV